MVIRFLLSIESVIVEQSRAVRGRLARHCVKMWRMSQGRGSRRRAHAAPHFQ
jgi:hypothetical protein